MVEKLDLLRYVFIVVYITGITLNAICSDGILRHVEVEKNTGQTAQERTEESGEKEQKGQTKKTEAVSITREAGVYSMLILGVLLPMFFFKKSLKKASRRSSWEGTGEFTRYRTILLALAIALCSFNIGAPIFYYRDYELRLEKKDSNI